MNSRIYLDHHSSTFLSKEAFEAMLPYMQEKWGNYIQPHEEGAQLVSDIRKGLNQIRNFFQDEAKGYTPVFVSSVAEANHQVYHHVYHQVIRETGRNHLITLGSEDASILLPLKELEKLGGCLTLLSINQKGTFDPNLLINSITPRTGLISFALGHGLSGVVHDIEPLKEICELRKILLHLDLSYVVGKIELDLSQLGADFVTFGGSLLHGPKSSGMLFAKDTLYLKPFIQGGLEQRGLRAGPLDTAQLIGLAKACEVAKDFITEMNLEIASLRNYFEFKLLEVLDEVDVLFQESNRLPNVSVISFSKVHADSLLYALNKRGVSACMGGGSFQKLSLLLENSGHSSLTGHTSLSFALSRKTTSEEVDHLIGILYDEVSRLRSYTQNMESIYGNP